MNSELKKMKYYSPEIEILLLCARSKMDKDKISRIRTLCKEKIDWGYLVSVARINKMVQLLYVHINSICSEQVPKIFLNYLREYSYNSTKSNLYLTKELCKLTDLFDANDIQVIPYKGPTLAISLYNNLALREFSDLDILVHKKDFPKIKNILLQERFYSEHDMTPTQERAYLKYYCEYGFDRDDRKRDIHLEIHFGFLNKYFSLPIEPSGLWDRCERICFENRNILNPSPENLLLILCIQGAKNCWDVLRSICDVSELINVRKDINWEYVINTATKAGVRQMLFLGLYLANNLLQSEVPEEVLQKMGPAKRIKALAEKVYERLFGPPKGEIGIAETILFQLKVRDRLIDKIKYFIRFAITPSFGDWKSFDLPTYLSFVYYFIRPIRLLKQVLFKMFRLKRLLKFKKTPDKQLVSTSTML